MQVLELKSQGVCGECGGELAVGTRVRYYSREKMYHSGGCPPGSSPRHDVAPPPKDILSFEAITAMIEVLEAWKMGVDRHIDEHRG